MKKSLVLIVCLLFLITITKAQITFTSQTTPTTEDLWGISFANANIGYACGDSGTILKTLNGGNTWTALTSGTIDRLNFIKVIPGTGGQKVIAVGDNNTIIKSTNGGSTWTAQTVPFAIGSFVFGIQIVDSLKYFACGGDFSTTSGAVLKTTNGGTTWTKTAVAGTFFLDKLLMFNDTTGIAVGATSTGGTINRATNGTSFPSVLTSPSTVINLWAISPTKIVSVGLNGQIWKSTNAGATWVSHSYNATDLYAVQFNDSLNGYACGGITSNIILNTTDGGITWSQIPFTFSGALIAICIIDDKIYMAGDQGKIIKATLPTTTGINDIESNSAISVYPNPASKEINITIDNQYQFSSMKILMFDVDGRKIKEETISNSSSIINISELQSGLYFYQLRNGNTIIRADKILIIR